MRANIVAFALALGLVLAQAVDPYPVVASEDTCAIPTVEYTTADGVYTTSGEFVAAALAIIGNVGALKYVTPECSADAVSSLPICLFGSNELIKKEGCCDPSCASALKASPECFDRLLAELCDTQAPGIEKLRKPLLNTAHRCVTPQPVDCAAAIAKYKPPSATQNPSPTPTPAATSAPKSPTPTPAATSSPKPTSSPSNSDGNSGVTSSPARSPSPSSKKSPKSRPPPKTRSPPPKPKNTPRPSPKSKRPSPKKSM